jgi:hypothetical protein
VNINGANLEHQPEDFQEEFNALFGKVKDRVILRGTYRQQDIEALMLENGWVVMQSTSWENLLVVIQNALFYGRPILGCNIGGTAEKVDGCESHILAMSNPSALTSAMLRDRVFQATLPRNAYADSRNNVSRATLDCMPTAAYGDKHGSASPSETPARMASCE